MFTAEKAVQEFNTKALQAGITPLTKVIKEYGPALALPAVAGAIQYLFSKKNIKQEIEALKSSYAKAMGMSEKMKADPERSASVFQELSTVAPSVAMNPSMAIKVIEPRLQKGLTIDDVHKLTMINAYAKPSPLAKSPMADAKRSAGFAADRLFTTLGLKAFEDATSAYKQSKKNLSAFASKRQEMKEGKYNNEDLQKFYEGFNMNKESSQQVSEKCAIEMMADRYVLFKNSPLYKEASIISKATNVLAEAAPYMVATLGTVGVIHGVGAAIDMVQKKKLELQANAAFAQVQKSSDIIKGNKELAEQAFDAIKTFAPSLAAKPAILKTFLEHSVSVEGRIPPEMVNQLATAQGNIGRSKPAGFASGFVDTASSVGKMVEEKKKNDNRGWK
jgi:hypothetical protein